MSRPDHPWEVRRCSRTGLFYVAGILPERHVQPGQFWLSSSGHVVRVTGLDRDMVHYTRREKRGSDPRPEEKHWQKDNFSFQCRYALVVPTNELPRGLR
jgi:hypothetical protein